jgi:hypothetical protein
MTTTLTTPILAPAATKATVDGWSLRVGRNADLTVEATSTVFTAQITLRSADGASQGQRSLSILASDMTGGAQTSLRSFHNSVTAYLRAQGLLPAGVDTQDV